MSNPRELDPANQFITENVDPDLFNFLAGDIKKLLAMHLPTVLEGCGGDRGKVNATMSCALAYVYASLIISETKGEEFKRQRALALGIVEVNVMAERLTQEQTPGEAN